MFFDLRTLLSNLWCDKNIKLFSKTLLWSGLVFDLISISTFPIFLHVIILLLSQRPCSIFLDRNVVSSILCRWWKYDLCVSSNEISMLRLKTNSNILNHCVSVVGIYLCTESLIPSTFLNLSSSTLHIGKVYWIQSYVCAKFFSSLWFSPDTRILVAKKKRGGG